MRTMKLALLGITSLGFLGMATQANAEDLSSATSAANIQGAIAISETTGLDFATVIADSSGDVVTLTTGGGISSTGSSTFSGSPTNALFAVTGDASTAVTISFSSSDTLTGPGTAMGLGNFQHDAGGSPAFTAGGTLALNVGADLTVNASQTAGAYSGTYTLTIDY